LSLRFSQSDARARVLAAGLRWCGPALFAFGLIGIAAMALMARVSPFAGWFLLHALAPERLLPLIGLGTACGLVGAPIFAVTLALFVLGIAGGLAMQGWLISTIYTIAEGPTYLFLTGPISCLAIGLALVPGARLLPWLLPLAAFIAGTMLALAVFLTDPSLHDPLYVLTPTLAAIWITGAVALTLQVFRRGWFAIFGRILGSWLVAVGLLYGGASLLPILKPPPPLTDTSQESTRGAELKQSNRHPLGSEPLRPAQPQPDSFSGGIKRLPP
jgi:hypothetical protein